MVTTWTNVSKASGTAYTNIPKRSGTGSPATGGGSPIGLLLAITYAGSGGTPADTVWTKITKASGTSYTNVAKAT